MENTLFKKFHWSFFAIGAVLLLGLALSLVSFLDLCTEECKAGHNWSLFGLPFAPIGIIFFSMLLILLAFSQRYSLAKTWLEFALATSLGAEVMLILVQKYQIGHWCPVCLGIAASLLAAALILFFNDSKGDSMNSLSKKMMSLAMFALGFATIYIGIAEVNPLVAMETSLKEKMIIGNPNATVQAYLFTDWSCPACRALEPTIKSLMPVLTSKSNLTFVDLPVHPATLNYSPYNLAFMINNKNKYLQIRDKLTALSETTDAPTEAQIKKIAKEQGVDLKELNYSDVSLSLKYWEELASNFKVDATPTLVLFNPNTKKSKKLSGGQEITEEQIKKAITDLSK